MHSQLNKELESRSIQLAALAEMQPDDRIARITWDRIQDDLEQSDSMVYGMRFCIANITSFIKTSFKENEHTIAAQKSCHQLIIRLGWGKEEVLSMEQSSKVFIDYIKDVVKAEIDQTESKGSVSDQWVQHLVTTTELKQTITDMIFF